MLILLSLGIGFSQDIKKIDSLNNEFSLAKDDSTRFRIRYNLFLEYYNFDTEEALSQAEQSLKLALLIGDSMAIVRSYHASGDMKMETGDVLAGIEDMEIALEIAARNKFENRAKYLVNNLALAYTRSADFDKALKYNFQALREREEEGDKELMTVSYNNIGLVYLELNDYENALTYFNRSFDLAVESGRLDGLEVRLINLGYCYNALERYDEAIESFLMAFEACSDKCNPTMLTSLHNALGIGYLKSKLIDEAENQFVKSIELSKKVGSTRHESIGLRCLSEIRLYQGNPFEAIELLDSSQSIALKTDLKIQILDNYLSYSAVYSELGDFRRAADYQKKYINLNKEVFSSDLIQKISRITTDYEERENIKTIASKNQVLALREEIIARQKQQYVFIITITFLTLGLAFVMYRANQSQRKINQELAKAKETIQRQNEMLSDANLQLESEVQERTQELVESNESLVKVNDEMDNFIYKTSHDIRGPLASLKGICNVAMMDVKDEAALDYLSKLDTSAAKLNAILSRLLIINQINHSILTPEKINFEEQIVEILELEKKKEMPERINITYYVQPDLDFRSDKEMAKIILENLIDNAIKYHNDSTRIDPFVKIEIGMEGDWVSVKVIDNGIGIDEESKDKIFQLFVRASERSDSGGIGLYLSKLATVKLGGDIYLSKSKEGYTVFKVLFPPDLVPVIEKRKAEELKREKQKQKVLKVS